MQTQDRKPITIGEKLVGLTFNPSNNPNVQKAKELCAELADLIIANTDNTSLSGLEKILLDNTLCQILNAQMNAVKILTLK